MNDNYKRLNDPNNNNPPPKQNLMEMQTIYKQKRDNFLDAAIKTTDQTTKLQENINQELKNQDQELDRLNKKLDKVNTQMGSLANKMEEFLKNTSNTCLYMAIAISGFIFLLLVSI